MYGQHFYVFYVWVNWLLYLFLLLQSFKFSKLAYTWKITISSSTKICITSISGCLHRLSVHKIFDRVSMDGVLVAQQQYHLLEIFNQDNHSSSYYIRMVWICQECSVLIPGIAQFPTSRNTYWSYILISLQCLFPVDLVTILCLLIFNKSELLIT